MQSLEGQKGLEEVLIKKTFEYKLPNCLCIHSENHNCGHSNSGGSQSSEILRELRVRGFFKSGCTSHYTVSKTDDSFSTIKKSLPLLFQDSSVFCAGRVDNNAGTCKGDSGGAIHYFDLKKQRTYLKG